MYPIKEHSITQTYKSFHAITLKDAWENAFFVLMDKLLRCAMALVNTLEKIECSLGIWDLPLGAVSRAPENIFCPQAATFWTEIVHENA